MNRVGISNESHFVHEFKKAHGLAPSKYRSALAVTAAVESGSMNE